MSSVDSLNSLGGVKIRGGLFVIAVPTLWKLETGTDTADEVCTHVAKQMFGTSAELYAAEDLGEAAEIYLEAVLALEAECLSQNRSLEVVEPLDMVVRIGGAPVGVEGKKKEAGLRWLRVVKRNGFSLH